MLSGWSCYEKGISLSIFITFYFSGCIKNKEVSVSDEKSQMIVSEYEDKIAALTKDYENKIFVIKKDYEEKISDLSKENLEQDKKISQLLDQYLISRNVERPYHYYYYYYDKSCWIDYVDNDKFYALLEDGAGIINDSRKVIRFEISR